MKANQVVGIIEESAVSGWERERERERERHAHIGRERERERNGWIACYNP